MGAAPGMEDTLWMVVVGFMAGFVYAFGIGANDVANSFASSVASKSLSSNERINLKSNSNNKSYLESLNNSSLVKLNFRSSSSHVNDRRVNFIKENLSLRASTRWA